MTRPLVLLLALMATTAVAQGPVPLPNAEQAQSAYSKFAADPVHRLDVTRPFLDFIRTSGEVHIVLNEALLGWMYDDFDETNKAVLYAAFLGGNMSSQLTRHETGSDDLAGMRGALAAYRAIRAQQPDFTLDFFDRLAAADDSGEFDRTVAGIIAGTAEKP